MYQPPQEVIKSAGELISDHGAPTLTLSYHIPTLMYTINQATTTPSLVSTINQQTKARHPNRKNFLNGHCLFGGVDPCPVG